MRVRCIILLLLPWNLAVELFSMSAIMLSRLMINIQLLRPASTAGSLSIPSITARGVNTVRFRTDTQAESSTLISQEDSNSFRPSAAARFTICLVFWTVDSE